MPKSLAHLKFFAKKVRSSCHRWLLTNKWGQRVLVGLAPLIATPDDLENVRSHQGSTLARIGQFSAPFVGASFFSWATSSIPHKFISDLAEASGSLSDSSKIFAEHEGMTLTASILISCTIFLYVIGFLRWIFHRLCVFLLKKMRFPASPKQKTYFLLMAGSTGVWSGLGLLAFTWGYTLLTSQPNRLYDFGERHMGVVLVGLIALALLMDRRDRMSAISLSQMYPTVGARIVCMAAVLICILGLLMLLGLLAASTSPLP